MQIPGLPEVGCVHEPPQFLKLLSAHPARITVSGQRWIETPDEGFGETGARDTAALLDGMGKFVGEQPGAFAGLGGVLSVAEDDVTAHGASSVLPPPLVPRATTAPRSPPADCAAHDVHCRLIEPAFAHRCTCGAPPAWSGILITSSATRSASTS